MTISDWVAIVTLGLGIISWIAGKLVFDKFKALESKTNSAVREAEALTKRVNSVELKAVETTSKLERECLARDTAASREIEALRRDTEHAQAQLIEQNHRTERNTAEQISEIRETVAGFGAVYLSRKEFNDQR